MARVPDDNEEMLGAGLEEVLVEEEGEVRKPEETAPCPCVADVVTVAAAARADNALGGGALSADELGAGAPGGREVGAGAPGGREVGAGTPGGREVCAGTPGGRELGAGAPGAWELGAGPPGARALGRGAPADTALVSGVPEGELWLVCEALELGTRPETNKVLRLWLY